MTDQQKDILKDFPKHLKASNEMAIAVEHVLNGFKLFKKLTVISFQDENTDLFQFLKTKGATEVYNAIRDLIKVHREIVSYRTARRTTAGGLNFPQIVNDIDGKLIKFIVNTIHRAATYVESLRIYINSVIEGITNYGIINMAAFHPLLLIHIRLNPTIEHHDQKVYWKPEDEFVQIFKDEFIDASNFRRYNSKKQSYSYDDFLNRRGEGAKDFYLANGQSVIKGLCTQMPGNFAKFSQTDDLKQRQIADRVSSFGQLDEVSYEETYKKVYAHVIGIQKAITGFNQHVKAWVAENSQ